MMINQEFHRNSDHSRRAQARAGLRRRAAGIEPLEARIAPAFTSPAIAVANLDGTNGFTLKGAANGDHAGSSVSNAHGIRVSAAFFAPEMAMRPERRLPPRIRIRSISGLLD